MAPRHQTIQGGNRHACLQVEVHPAFVIVPGEQFGVVILQVAGEGAVPRQDELVNPDVVVDLPFRVVTGVQSYGVDLGFFLG